MNCTVHPNTALRDGMCPVCHVPFPPDPKSPQPPGETTDQQVRNVLKHMGHTPIEPTPVTAEGDRTGGPNFISPEALAEMEAAAELERKKKYVEGLDITPPNTGSEPTA